MRDPHPEDFDPDYASKVNPNIKPEAVNLTGVERIKTRQEVEQEMLSKQPKDASIKTANKPRKRSNVEPRKHGNVVPRKDVSTETRKRGTTEARKHVSKKPTIKKTFGVTETELDFLETIKFEMREYKATKDGVVKLALQMLREDYEEKKDNSYIVSKLKENHGNT